MTTGRSYVMYSSFVRLHYSNVKPKITRSNVYNVYIFVAFPVVKHKMDPYTQNIPLGALTAILNLFNLQFIVYGAAPDFILDKLEFSHSHFCTVLDTVADRGKWPAT